MVMRTRPFTLAVLAVSAVLSACSTQPDEVESSDSAQAEDPLVIKEIDGADLPQDQRAWIQECRELKKEIDKKPGIPFQCPVVRSFRVVRSKFSGYDDDARSARVTAAIKRITGQDEERPLEARFQLNEALSEKACRDTLSRSVNLYLMNVPPTGGPIPDQATTRQDPALVTKVKDAVEELWRVTMTEHKDTTTEIEYKHEPLGCRERIIWAPQPAPNSCPPVAAVWMSKEDRIQPAQDDEFYQEGAKDSRITVVLIPQALSCLQ